MDKNTYYYIINIIDFRGLKISIICKEMLENKEELLQDDIHYYFYIYDRWIKKLLTEYTINKLTTSYNFLNRRSYRERKNLLEYKIVGRILWDILGDYPKKVSIRKCNG